MREPVQECTLEGLKELLKEWKTRLFLDDWIIKVMFAKPDDPSMEGLQGNNSFVITLKTAVIKIATPEVYGNDRLMKYCVELTLVHELLHCKYNWLVSEESYEGKYFDVMEHTLMEQMARSLIMAKYDIPLEWFYNDKE